MNTPICDFVSEYMRTQAVRLHMPGHKGQPLLGMESLDITEIDGADVLYSANGIISESMENARRLFKSGRTLYSTEGSSLSIRAMLYLASLWGQSAGKDRLVLAGRNAHRVFHSAAALLDLDVKWLYGNKGGLMRCDISPDTLQKALSECDRKPFAVYLTSPDYLGNMLDIGALSEICKRHGVLCLVDNAHGAYLNFLKDSLHPISLGAHMCADSAHKTLPALTGAGYLHISADVPREISEQADIGMALFASTSPSYLILQSLDAVNKYLDEDYSEKLSALCGGVFALRSRLTEKGYKLIGDEPIKLTVDAKAYGYYGYDLAKRLSERNIVCEHVDRDVIVLMLTPQTSEDDLARLEAALLSVNKKAPIVEIPPMPLVGERVLTVREATLFPKERLSVKDAVGRILADSAVSCPPAVPIAVCGERVTENTLALFEYYGIDTVYVVK